MTNTEHQCDIFELEHELLRAQAETNRVIFEVVRDE